MLTLAAVCGIVGSLVPVTRPALTAGFASAPLLIVLSLLPVAVALSLVLIDRQRMVVGAAAALAMFAIGQLLSDLQFAIDVSRSARPELAVPTSLDPLRPGLGLWFLVARHLLVIAAAVVAGYHRRRTEHADDVAADATGLAQPGTAGQGRFTAALALAVLAVAALLLSEPFGSDNVYLVSASLFEQPPLVLAGGLVVTIAALVSIVLGGGPDRVGADGWAIGAAAGLALVGLPSLIAGLATAQLHPSWGPYALIVVAIALVGMAAQRRAGTTKDADAVDADEVELPTLRRLHVITAVLGVLAGVAALIGSFTGQLVLPPGLPEVHSTDAALLLPAGLLVGALAATMAMPRLASRVRPALAVGWVAIPMVALAELDFAFTALQINGVRAGFGTWMCAVAALLAVATACSVGLAGIADEPDADESATLMSAAPTARLLLIAVAALAAVCSVGGFGLPLLSGTDRGVPYQAPGVLSNFRLASWGLVLATIAVLVAVLVALFSPPAKAVALWLGSAAVLGVRLLGIPAARAQLAVQPSAAVWLTTAAIVVLFVAAGLAFALPTGADHTDPGERSEHVGQPG